MEFQPHSFFKGLMFKIKTLNTIHACLGLKELMENSAYSHGIAQMPFKFAQP